MRLRQFILDSAWPWPVAAWRLRGRRLRALDAEMTGVSLFPFFDRQGRVQRVMVLVAGSPRIRMLDWRRGLLGVAMFGPIRMAAGIREARVVPGDVAHRLRGLWHYDPRWLLDDEPHVRHPAAAALRATNCADRLRPDVKMLHFARDLSRVSLVTTRKRGSINLARWQGSFLPAIQVQPSPIIHLSPKTPWQLDPIWQRWTLGAVASAARLPPLEAVHYRHHVCQ